jgi:hypothetical protein
MHLVERMIAVLTIVKDKVENVSFYSSDCGTAHFRLISGLTEEEVAALHEVGYPARIGSIDIAFGEDDVQVPPFTIKLVGSKTDKVVVIHGDTHEELISKLGSMPVESLSEFIGYRHRIYPTGTKTDFKFNIYDSRGAKTSPDYITLELTGSEK